MDSIASIFPCSGHSVSRIGGRGENQDYTVTADTPLGCLVTVCDGMGGGPGGATASYVAAETVRSYVSSCDAGRDRGEVLKEAVAEANAALAECVRQDSSLRGMGSTIVAALVNEASAVIVHVGDSRFYKIRRGGKVFRTNDHSVVAQLVRAKTITEEQARLSSQSNIITQALGSSQCEPEIDEIAFERGDRFLLCTDGIWGAMPEPELLKEAGSGSDVSATAEKLAMKVDSIGKENGGHHDNLTLVLLKLTKDSDKKEKMNRKSLIIIGVLGCLLLVSLLFNIFRGGNAGDVDAVSGDSLANVMAAKLDSCRTEMNCLRDSIDMLKSQERGDLTRELEQRAAKNAGEEKAAEVKKKDSAEKRDDGAAEKKADDAEKRDDRHKAADEKVSKADAAAIKTIVGLIEDLKGMKGDSKAEAQAQAKAKCEKVVNLFNSLSETVGGDVRSNARSAIRDIVMSEDKNVINDNGAFVINQKAKAALSRLEEILKNIKNK